jgi:hypothetical protein
MTKNSRVPETASVRFNAPKGILAGLIYIAVGATAFITSHNYTIGTLLDMGPGFFPAMIGIILVGLGIGSVVVSLRKTSADPIVKLNIEPLLLILAGTVSFALLIVPAGLFVASAALIFLACFRRLLTNPVEVFLTYAALAGFSAVVFVHVLHLPIPLFWWES